MHPMIRLLASNRKKGHFRAETKTGTDEATIYLYDMIVDSDVEAEWWGGVSPKAFIEALNSIDAKTIHLRVNSPGGSVFAARAIEQSIREHKSEIVAHVDGLAASAASFLIMAADRVEMAPGSFLMIHKAWTLAFGNDEDLIKTAGLLTQIDASLVKTYAKRSGQPEDDIAAMLKAETWLDSEKSVELGFANLVAIEQPAKASAWDLSAFENAPNLSPAAEKDKDLSQDSGPDRDAMARSAKVRITVPA